MFSDVELIKVYLTLVPFSVGWFCKMIFISSYWALVAVDNFTDMDAFPKETDAS